MKSQSLIFDFTKSKASLTNRVTVYSLLIRWQEGTFICIQEPSPQRTSLKFPSGRFLQTQTMVADIFADDFGSIIFTLLAVILLSLLILTARKVNKENKEWEEKKRWWKEGVIYHIYPRSFQDSTGDGNGDLQGITKRLDYFEFLGIKILYLSPIFRSPMVDNGYDISDFKDIDPMFGNLQDFEELLKEAHLRGMKLILDFVANHTSDQHPWFIESRSSKVNPKRDWYVWLDPAPGGGPPNNWVSVFGGSAWTYDAKTNQYYLHQFCPEQPDLNLRNAEVLGALNDVLTFWLDRGVDGFRADAVAHLVEDSRFQDEPTKDGYDTKRPRYDDLDHVYTKNFTANHKIVQGWRAVLDQYKDSYRILIGEILDDNFQEVIKYYGGRFSNEFDFPFNFGLLGLSQFNIAEEVYHVISDYLAALPKGKWPNWLLGNHDFPRIGSKVSHEYCRALNVLLLTLPGTAVTYYGEEIGMIDAKVPFKSQKDFRDPQRSPMQWCDKENAGFTPATKAWVPVAENYKTTNVEFQKADPTSALYLYKELVNLRSTIECFKGLSFKAVYVDASVLAYTRSDRHHTFVIMINFGKDRWEGSLNGISGSGVVVIDSEMKQKGTNVSFVRVTLNKAQALVIKMQ